MSRRSSSSDFTSRRALLSFFPFFNGKEGGEDDSSTGRVNWESFDGDFGIDSGIGEDDGDLLRFPFNTLQED